MTRLGFLAAVLLYAALAVGGWVGVGLAVVGAAGLLAAGYSRRDGLLLLGPFARWELVRTARRSWLHLWRPLLAAAALAVAWLAVLFHTDRYGVLLPADLTRAAGTAFHLIGGFTLGLAGLFAVFQLPGVIAEEREKNRLEHLFVTDLRNREVLVGKVVGRLAVLAGYALVPVPVLALLTLVGGVDPLQVVVLGGMFLAWLVAVAGVAVACSAVSRKTATAVLLTIAVLFGLRYGAKLPQLADDALRLIPAGAAAELPPWANTARLAAADACRFLADGDPSAAWDQMEAAGRAGTTAAEFGPILRRFLAGQLLVLTVAWWVASRYLRRPPRPVGGAGGAKGWRAFFTHPARRPPVSDRPVTWYDATTPMTPVGRVARKLYIGVWWVPAALWMGFVIVIRFLLPEDDWDGYAMAVRGSGFYAFLFVTVPVAWVACRGVVRERERDTLDALLLTRLSPVEIVYQKFRAAVLSARGRLLFAAAVWFGAVLGRPEVLGAAFALTVITCANAVLAAAIGVWVSVRSKSGNAAFLWLFVVYTVWTFGSCFLTAFMFIPAAVGAEWLSFALLAVLGALNPLANQTAAGYIGLRAGGGASSDDALTLILTGVVGLGAMAAAGASFAFVRTAADFFRRKHRPRPRRYD